MAYKQMSYAERIKIEALSAAGHTARQIAALLSRHPSTIYRELSRGRYERMDTNLILHAAYSADIAQQDSNYRCSGKGPALKLGNDFAFVQFIESKILNERYSPAAALAALAFERPDIRTRVCVKTLYNYIGQGLFLRLTKKDLLRHGGRRQGYERVQRVRTRNPLFPCISERPVWANQRREAGHWEMDTVYGTAKSGQALLVLTERVTLREMIVKIKGRTRREVVMALNRLERQYGADFYRIFG